MLENKTAGRAFLTLHVGTWRRWRHYPSRKWAYCCYFPAETPPKTPFGGQLQHRELSFLALAVVRSTLPKLRSLPRTLQRDSRSDPSVDLDSLAGLDESWGGDAGRRGRGARAEDAAAVRSPVSPPSRARRDQGEATPAAPPGARTPSTRCGRTQSLAGSCAQQPAFSAGARLPSPSPGAPARLLLLWAPSKGGETEGGRRRYLEILHFLRPPSSATAAATPGDFLFFFTGIFRPPRQGGQGSRGRGSLSAGDASVLAAGSQTQQQAEEQSRQPAAQRPSPAAARTRISAPSSSARGRGHCSPADTAASSHREERARTARHLHHSHTRGARGWL